MGSGKFSIWNWPHCLDCHSVCYIIYAPNVETWFTSLIITLVFAKFTLSPLLSIQFFHAAYLAPNSSKVSAIIIKSSVYNVFQGRLLLRFLKRGLRTTISNKKGLKQVPDVLLLLYQTDLPQCYFYTWSWLHLLAIHEHLIFS